ncbi:hypothetical protein Tco_0802627 [Tanacetum coccineum]|uniref:Uncharacterized protein n=1 Tax=Tanacetum coccineum TaxID=301880 RepID=A0ABQ4ZZB8_9ASTR
MPSDDLAPLTAFETHDSDDEASISVTKEHSADNLNATSDGDVALPNASAGVSALSDSLGHLRRELTTISSKVDWLESKITKRVSDDLKSSIPSLVFDALKGTLPVQQFMGEQASLFQVEVHQTLEEQLDTMIYKPIKKQFRTFNKLESNQFVILQTELSKGSLQDNSDRVSDLTEAIQNTNFLLNAAEVFKKANVEVEKWEKNNPKTPKDSEIPKPLEQKLFVEQFTDQLFSTTCSTFAPSPPREPTPPRDPSKGKGVATEEPMKELIPYIEEGGSDPNMLKMKSLVTLEGELSQEEFMAQLKEIVGEIDCNRLNTGSITISALTLDIDVRVSHIVALDLSSLTIVLTKAYSQIQIKTLQVVSELSRDSEKEESLDQNK